MGSALDSAKDYFQGRYTGVRMIEDHIGLLTDANGYTAGAARATSNVMLLPLWASWTPLRWNRDIVAWIKGVQAKGLLSKTIANVHGLISAAFNSLVREKPRADNPCKGVALPKSEAKEETATFLTAEEWARVEACGSRRLPRWKRKTSKRPFRVRT